VDLSCENTWILGLKGNQHLLLWLRNKADRWDHVLRDEQETPLLGPIKLPRTALGEYSGSVQLLSPFQEPLGKAVLTDNQLTLPTFKYSLLVRMDLCPGSFSTPCRPVRGLEPAYRQFSGKTPSAADVKAAMNEGKEKSGGAGPTRSETKTGD
jgi:hypothetical protein